MRARRDGPGTTLRELRTPDDVRDAVAAMFPTPKTGDWRADVLGVEDVSVQSGPDGWPLVNGHRVTEEMCAALQADRPEQASYFVYDDLVALAAELGPPSFEGLGDVLGSSGAGCSGLQLDHRDGSMSCSRGQECPGVALPHSGWTSCETHGPCAHCEGPPVRWVHTDA